MKKILITILFIVFALPVSAYYNPGQPIGYVNDFAGVIDDAIEQDIESRLVQFERETSNEITVVTINSLEEDYIENFAEKLFQEWGIGKADKDNGALVLVAIEDREMRIEVGYGLEGALTDVQSFWIIDNIMKPAFREEKYGEGISDAVDKIIAATKGEYAAEGSSDGGSKFDVEFIFWISIFAFLWLSAILGRSKSWWAGGVIGGIAGVIIGLIKGFLWLGIISVVALIPLGLLFDFIVSKKYTASRKAGRRPPWWIGGGRGGSGFGSGGFGGFGGGMSGGGGSSGSW